MAGPPLAAAKLFIEEGAKVITTDIMELANKVALVSGKRRTAPFDSSY
ncbi:hypothetical protein [Caballeronia sp. SL2Y3]|nr:hypothetical protein [Caballeronia sp. SL2Y3]